MTNDVENPEHFDGNGQIGWLVNCELRLALG